MTLIPIIISGGSGSRLWPISRKSHPKPFMRLNDGKSLLQNAFLRAASLRDVTEILTVTNQELLFGTLEEYSQVNQQQLPLSFVLEPFGRDTAAAVAAATLVARDNHGDDTILFLLPADHIVRDLQAFEQAVSRATEIARGNRLVTLGVHPTHPETAFGYIEADGEDVLQFVEKPSVERASEYVRGGRHFWNAGMLCFKAATLLELMEQYCPDIIAAVRASLSASTPLEGVAGKGFTMDASTFARVPALSLDYALLEKAPNVAMVACDMGWSDVGSWNAIAELGDADEAGNQIEGPAELVTSSRCYVRGDTRLIGAVGLEDIVIVDSPDALLVAHRNSLQAVKTLFDRLKEKNHPAHEIHQTVHRPWGSYTVLGEGEGFKIKRIEVKPGASLSLQMHHHRSEHWVVVTGQARVVNDDREFLLEINQSTYIEKQHRHRLANPTDTPLVIIEVQCGAYLGEDDIVRFDDVYGRS
jgi:mannose-1-phosphate guanylyltransferase/mannose-6-phosphate isomerase